MENLLVVGGGASGLMAAAELMRQSNPINILLLEGSERLGGRIYTSRDKKFSLPVEKGVEFIHGELPLTSAILKEAGIDFQAVEGRMYRIENNSWKEQVEIAVGWDNLIRKMNEVEGDVTVKRFLETYFHDEKYEELRKTVTRFAEGFDLADTNDASILELREEWMETDEQFRLKTPFDEVIEFLRGRLEKGGVEILLNSAVRKVKWRRGEVAVTTTTGKVFHAEKVLITVPLSVLQLDEESERSILFEPQLADCIKAAREIGFGTVVKTIIEFDRPFWEDVRKDVGFIFSDELIPTWWTKLPEKNCLLTGWAGGPQAYPLMDKTDGFILDAAVKSLSHIFPRSIREISSSIKASTVVNWRKQPFIRGAYSFNYVGSRSAKELLNLPVDNTIFFAGEALYSGASPGTVEAALVSGKAAAEKIKAGEI